MAYYILSYVIWLLKYRQQRKSHLKPPCLSLRTYLLMMQKKINMVSSEQRLIIRIKEGLPEGLTLGPLLFIFQCLGIYIYGDFV